jgi:hypothetical protein
MTEDVQEPFLRLRFNRLRGQPAQRAKCLPHLLQVDSASRALPQMSVEPQPLESSQPILQVIGHELYKLLARQVVVHRRHARSATV